MKEDVRYSVQVRKHHPFGNFNRSGMKFSTTPVVISRADFPDGDEGDRLLQSVLDEWWLETEPYVEAAPAPPPPEIVEEPPQEQDDTAESDAVDDTEDIEAPDAPGYTVEELDSPAYTVKELRRMAADMNVSTSGRKSVLAARIAKASMGGEVNG